MSDFLERFAASVRGVGLVLRASDIAAFKAAGKTIVQSGHGERVVHQGVGVEAHSVEQMGGDVGPDVEQRAADGIFEVGRNRSRSHAQRVGPVHGEDMPLGGGGMLESSQAGEDIYSGVDNVVGVHEAILKLRRYATGPRVALQAERRA